MSRVVADGLHEVAVAKQSVCREVGVAGWENKYKSQKARSGMYKRCDSLHVVSINKTRELHQRCGNAHSRRGEASGHLED